jgi:hypothetical protein
VRIACRVTCIGDSNSLAYYSTFGGISVLSAYPVLEDLPDCRLQWSVTRLSPERLVG